MRFYSPDCGIFDDVLVLDNVCARHSLAAAVGTVHHDGFPCGAHNTYNVFGEVRLTIFLIFSRQKSPPKEDSDIKTDQLRMTCYNLPMADVYQSPERGRLTSLYT